MSGETVPFSTLCGREFPVNTDTAGDVNQLNLIVYNPDTEYETVPGVCRDCPHTSSGDLLNLKKGSSVKVLRCTFSRVGVGA